tara:strand:+ start:404 stop:880 length:477 start_codon:yes stop_codon:yes gene_type:complete
MSNLSLTTLTVSAIIVDTVIGYYLLITKRGGRYIKEWYKTFTIGAYTMDVLSIVIGTYIATSLTNNVYKQLLFVIIVGLIHDISFGVFLSKTNVKSTVLDLFRNYANELGTTILIVDAFMLVSTILLAHFLKSTLSISNISYLGIVTLYIGLLMIYSF